MQTHKVCQIASGAPSGGNRVMPRRGIASDRRERGNLAVKSVIAKYIPNVKNEIAEFIPSAKYEIASLCSQ